MADPVREELARYDARAAADHGVPAVLHAREEGGLVELGTLVRVAEPGNYYLHLTLAGDGRVRAVFNRSPIPGEVVSGGS